MKIKMLQIGKYSLDGININVYSQDQILSDETPDIIKEYFLKMGEAVIINKRKTRRKKNVK